VLQLASPAVERTKAIGYTASAMGPELLERIRLAAARLVERGASSVYLFGSMTTGRAREDSDVDLAVVGLPPQIFFAALAEATRIIGRPVDLLALERHPELAEELFRSGELQRVA
jgi:predicted nucleotidyltransferase